MKFGFRFFITLTAGLTVFASVKPAFADHNVSGHARTRWELTENRNNTNTDNTEAVLNRVRLNVDVMPAKSLQVRISPEFAHDWGSLSGGTAGATFRAYEAWMAWMPNDTWSLYVGRQVLSYGNEVIIGANDWFQLANAFDAARARMTGDKYWADIFAAKIVEGSGHADGTFGGAGFGSQDHMLYGLYSSFNVSQDIEFLNSIDFYAMFNDDRVGGASRARFFVGGLRFAGDMESVFYDLEGTYEGGKATAFGTNTFNGFQIDATLGVTLMDKHTAAFNFAYANSEFLSIAPSVHNFFGDADTLGRFNILAFAIKTFWELTEEVGARVDGHYFLKGKKGLANTTATGATRATAAKRPLAMEVDVALSYSAEENLGFEAGYAINKPFSAIEDAPASATTGNKVHHDVYVQGTLKF